jgi:hypothetical protein
MFFGFLYADGGYLMLNLRDGALEKLYKGINGVNKLGLGVDYDENSNVLIVNGKKAVRLYKVKSFINAELVAMKGYETARSTYGVVKILPNFEGYIKSHKDGRIEVCIVRSSGVYCKVKRISSNPVKLIPIGSRAFITVDEPMDRSGRISTRIGVYRIRLH